MLAAGLLAGCSDSDDNDKPTDEDTPQQEIHLDADIWQVMEGTRTTTYDNATALRTEGSFTCAVYQANTTTAYVSPTAVNWSEAEWLFSDGKHYWPASGSLDFFAYLPATPPTYITTGPTYSVADSNDDVIDTHTVTFACAEVTTSAEAEFICALALDQDKAGTNNTTQPTAGQVALTFHHPFATVNFLLSAASGSNVTVNSITLTDIYQTATCTFDGTTSTWTSHDNANIFSANIGGNYIVIPNNYGTKTLTVNATWNDWSTVTKDISASISIDWQAGTRYTYTLTLKKYALTVDTEKYTEQW